MGALGRSTIVVTAAGASIVAALQCGGDGPEAGFTALGGAGIEPTTSSTGSGGSTGGSGAAGQGAAGGDGGSEPTDGGVIWDGGSIGGDRPVPLHVPPGYDPDRPTPLVVMLHGYGVDGPLQEAYLRFRPVADDRVFIYAYPNGTKDALGLRFWNATDACCDLMGAGVDDSSYLREVIEQIQMAFNIDPKRIYLVGHSNGGFMSYRLACDHADLIAAIAPMAGATFADADQCDPSAPVAVLHVHGTLDLSIAYGGGLLFGTPFPGAEDSARMWASYDGCLTVADTSPPPIDIESVLPGAETEVRRWAVGCDPGGFVELWTIRGGGHIPVLVSDFAERVVDFFYAHPKP